MRDTTQVSTDAADHYRHLIALGRDEFLAAAAPAALVRFRGDDELAEAGADTLTVDSAVSGDETLPHGKLPMHDVELEVFPLIKKPGASFPDRITIGRTPNNDIVVPDHSISRLHAYIRHGNGWFVADAGSKNGTWLGGAQLAARRERALESKTILRLGDVDLTFYLSIDLYEVLGGVR